MCCCFLCTVGLAADPQEGSLAITKREEDIKMLRLQVRKTTSDKREREKEADGEADRDRQIERSRARAFPRLIFVFHGHLCSYVRP